MNFKSSPVAKKTVNSSVILTGAPRTGTTLLGKIIATFEKFDYTFEPPMLRSILSLLENRQEQADQFQLLFESYCYEEILLQKIAGRTLNFNPYDDSYVEKVLPKDEIGKRLSRSWRKTELENQSKEYRLVMKIPSVIHRIEDLISYYQGISFVVSIRRPEDVIQSILKKEWFKNVSTLHPLITPFYIEGVSWAPDCIPSQHFEQWTNGSEKDRALLYYIHQYEKLKICDKLSLIDYNMLVDNPKMVIEELAATLKGVMTEKTAEIIKSIHSNNKGERFSWDDTQVSLKKRALELYSNMLTNSKKL